jgi:flagellar biosynthesis protein FlhA
MLDKLKSALSGGLGTPILLMMVLGMMTLPMPTFLLDLLFTFNIALSLIVLLVTIYSLRPLDFGAFPSVLLVATLMRLALNVASTRVVLLNGHEGAGAAGQVIEAFGSVVVGGNFAVGLVVFIILVIINFVVVTKGAGRISEVSARFTLDAMPGKQMAIDADLNAGLLSQEEARDRRKEVAMEADFYGAMDGASKFVRGDAIAGILILFINIIGGLGVGMGQHDLPFGLALEYYVLLTIGDGLVAQIPSLLLSVGAAIMVTRQAGAAELGTEVAAQLFESPKALAISALVLFIMGIVPGMPHVPFLLLAAGCGGLAYWMGRKIETASDKKPAGPKAGPPSAGGGAPPAPAPGGAAPPAVQGGEEVRELGWDDVTPVEPIGLEVGYRLIPLVDKSQNGSLLGRIKGVRKKLSQDLGFLIPAVHIRDNLDLAPNAYRIALMGVTVGEAEIYPDREMAINPGQVFGDIKGINGKDPAFGLDAIWIETDSKENAQTLGYTVVDASTVVATHISQLLAQNAAELLGHEEVQQLFKLLEKSSPKLVESLDTDQMPLGVVVKVLKNLLEEQVPIRDIRTIISTLAEYVGKSQDPVGLTAAVRVALKRLIVQNICGNEPALQVVTLDPQLEQILLQSVQVAGDEGASVEPGLAERLQNSVTELSQRQEATGQPFVIVTSAPIRPMMSRFARSINASSHVLSYQEIPDSKQIQIVGTVGQAS